MIKEGRFDVLTVFQDSMTSQSRAIHDMVLRMIAQLPITYWAIRLKEMTYCKSLTDAHLGTPFFCISCHNICIQTEILPRVSVDVFSE